MLVHPSSETQHSLNPALGPAFRMGTSMRNEPFQNSKHIKELDRILSDGEAARRRRWDARSKTLDWLLIAIVVILVVTAFTRAAVWLAKFF